MANNCNNIVNSSKPVDYEVFLPFTKLIYRIPESYLCHIKFPEIWTISCKNSVERWLPELRNPGFPSSSSYFLSGGNARWVAGDLSQLPPPPAPQPEPHQPFLSLWLCTFLLGSCKRPSLKAHHISGTFPSWRFIFFSPHSGTSGLKCRQI